MTTTEDTLDPELKLQDIFSSLKERFLEKEYLHLTSVEHVICHSLEAFRLNEFKHTWNNLPGDPYLPQQKIRQRRICKFEMRHDQTLTLLPDCHFYQSNTVNPLLGGIDRVYQQSEVEFHTSPLLLRLLHHQATFLNQLHSGVEWVITCHQFRVYCDPHSAGFAAPEGRHSDGHDYVFQHLIDRHNVCGGISEIYSSAGELLLSHTLRECLETLLINDRHVQHDVTPLQPADNAAGRGWRDMLIIDFDRLS